LNTSSDKDKVVRSVGHPPEMVDEQAVEYLRTKLEETRKDCQWLIGLGAASVFGALIRKNIDSSTITAEIHELTLVVIGLQMLIALIGAMSLWQGKIDKPQVLKRLELTLIIRYWLRNIALVLLVAAFLLIIYQIW